LTVSCEWPKSGKAKIVLLGEAPGETEEDLGRPFVGPSGKCLNHMLSSAKVERQECLVTNVFSERAPGNDVRPWMRDAHRYEPELARLATEFDRVQPNIVVALGATALWALTGMEALSRVRGSLTTASRVSPGLKLLPTLHPAFVLRQYELLTVVIGDLLKAKRESEWKEIKLPHRELWLDPTLDDLEYLWDAKIQHAPQLSLDLESGWGQISHFGVAWSRSEGASVPFIDLRKPDKNYWGTKAEEESAWQWVKRVAECPIPKVGQFYANYDALVLLKQMGIKTMNYCDDTFQIHGALHPEMSRSLAFLGARYSEQGSWKNMGRRQGGDEKDNG
jgi:uracil-DNA glycosylase family 4